LLSAGVAWSFASFFLISDGLQNLVEYSHHLQFHIMISFLSGAFFYIIFLKRLSDTQANQIYNLTKKNTITESLNSLGVYLILIASVLLLYYIKKKMYFHQVDTSVMLIIFGLGLFLSSIRFFFLFVFFLRSYKKHYTSKKYISV
jgi:hypothetical protein